MGIAGRIVCSLGLAACLLWLPPGVPAAAAEQEAAPLPGAGAPPFMLTGQQLFAWSADGPLADRRNVSRVPIAARFINPALEPDRNARFDPRVRVMLAPDGMNRFGNYLTPQRRFNLYDFTHWSHVDLLLWFGGDAGHPVAIPPRPWIDAAHRNGVKVLGTVFFAPKEFGGAPTTVELFLRQGRDGRFPAADRLIAIARTYGFDGWLINAETDLASLGPERAGALGRGMLAFMAYMRRAAPRPMELHWYDAMLPDGTVAWQNALTASNAPFLSVSDGLFLNYDWSRAGLERGAALAEARGRSRYELFVGADLWPGRSAQPAFRNVHWLDDLRGTGSIALFAANFNFNGGWFGSFDRDPKDVQRFYEAEVRLFAGDDLTMAGNAGGWPGIASLVPARSTIGALPFETHFNTGHGLSDARRGRIIGGAWHDMSRQDILPTWQFAASPGSAVRVQYDFARPYDGGSSLRVDAAGPKAEEVPLYLTRLRIGPATRLTLVTQTASRSFGVRLTLDGNRHLDLPIRSSRAWHVQSWCLGRWHGLLSRISILAGPAADRRPRALGVGELSLKDEATCLQSVPPGHRSVKSARRS